MRITCLISQNILIKSDGLMNQIDVIGKRTQTGSGIGRIVEGKTDVVCVGRKSARYIV